MLGASSLSSERGLPVPHKTYTCMSTTVAAQLALVVPQFFFPPTSLLGAIGFSATCELYFSRAILTTDVVVLTLYSYQYMRMMGGGPTI